MEQYTTYTIKSKRDGYVWRFKYHLNGNLKAFDILDGELTEAQMQWLSNHFPFLEEWMKEWKTKLSQNFEITIGDPDLSFEAMWQLYDHKVSKQDALKAYKKLAKNEGDLIKCFTAIPVYNTYIATTTIAKLHLSTYINGRRYEDELPTPVPPYKKPIMGKNFNPALADLAQQKTDK